MITNKLKIIFGTSIPLFVVHGTEEYMTHFYNVDTHYQNIFGFLFGLSNQAAIFITFQVLLWILLVVSFLLILGEKWQLNILAIIGLVYIYELHHIYKAMVVGGYYPGLYTAFLFPFLAFFFWKEWFINWKK